jgi:hypothetical protein
MSQTRGRRPLSGLEVHIATASPQLRGRKGEQTTPSSSPGKELSCPEIEHALPLFLPLLSEVDDLVVVPGGLVELRKAAGSTCDWLMPEAGPPGYYLLPESGSKALPDSLPNASPPQLC